MTVVLLHQRYELLVLALCPLVVVAFPLNDGLLRRDNWLCFSRSQVSGLETAVVINLREDRVVGRNRRRKGIMFPKQRIIGILL